MNIKAVINHTLVNEIMRLAAVWKEAERLFDSRKMSLGLMPGPSEAQVAGAADRAKTELRDFCYGLAQITPANDPTLALLRRQEIIADLGFDIGYAWRTMKSDVCSKIMDNIEGSRGLMQEINRWACEFDTFWEALPEGDDRRERYIEEIFDFGAAKLQELVEHHGR